ncbi:thiol reductant ABC exporter subunit CydC [Tenggerimyces flavus]|uniref:Thiol reductant ABC exporter subunit CydC n=1 Tax=Tenggerimyces flavus TaxID=1708749 RepID=A0ABV7Y999_9ACTN|nr:thiol reductant ABC exporter subunit CydC [Tenggerimyces flavus]MBM7786686.1 ATP-binding cassette subfamily C protein CydC/ATP-binding cassette subfamily C protein CydCD [Tenggerimyces flavus]
MRLRLAFAAIAGTAAAGSAVAMVAASAWLISRAAEHPPVLMLMVAIVGVRAFGLARAVLRYVERLLGHDAGYRLLDALRTRLYDKLELLAPNGLAAYRSGDLLARLVDDVDLLLDLVLRVALPIVVASLVGAGTAVLLGLLLPVVGAVTGAAVGLALVGVPLLVAWSAHRAERAVAPERGRLSAATTELLEAAPELIAFGATAHAIDKVVDSTNRLRAAERRSSWSVGLGNGLLTLLTGAASIAGIAVGVPAVRSGTLDQVLLAVVVLTPLALADVFASLAPAAATATRGHTALARVRDVLRAKEPVSEPDQPTTVPAGPYHLNVENLSVRWTDDGPNVLDGFGLDLSPGRKVALMGPSGSGKSTLAHALVRLVEPVSGRITLNGVDLTELRPDDLRQVVGLCQQDTYVFDTTVAENVRLARPDATDAEVQAVLDRVRLPLDLEARVGEHGDRISGGERRRLGLARCLLARTPILVLDEPTEHLEDDLADAILHVILTAARDQTILLITHRPPPAGLVDEIIVLGKAFSGVGSR